MYRGIDSAAVGMSQYHDQLRSQMIRSILDASELMIINDISGYPDHEQIPDPAVENRFRDHPRI